MSGGHCDECQDNTEGYHCERCIAGFYQQVDLLAPCADDVVEVFLDGKSDVLGRKSSQYRGFTIQCALRDLANLVWFGTSMSIVHVCYGLKENIVTVFPNKRRTSEG